MTRFARISVLANISVMKLSLLAIATGLLLATGFSSVQGDISVGDRRFEVLETLGEPKGFIGSDDFQIYYFERGEVTFRNGVVKSHTIVSAEEAASRQAAIEREREQQQRRKSEARDRRIEEGLAIRDEAIIDPQFNTRPATARLAFWNVFRQKYPEVDVDLHHSVTYQEARLEQAERLAEVERERQLRELEMRVMAAENQARSAEREAQLARERGASRYYSDYGHYYPRHPVVIHSHPHPRHKTERPRERSGRDIVVRSETEIRPSQRETIHDRLNADFMFPPLTDNLASTRRQQD